MFIFNTLFKNCRQQLKKHSAMLFKFPEYVLHMDYIIKEKNWPGAVHPCHVCFNNYTIYLVWPLVHLAKCLLGKKWYEKSIKLMSVNHLFLFQWRNLCA